MTLDLLKKIVPAIAFLMLSNAINSAPLLSNDDKGYDGVRIRSTGYEKPSRISIDGLSEGETLTKAIGERLHKATTIETKEIAKFVVDAPLYLYGEAGFLGTPKYLVAAGTHYSDFRVKHPVHGYLYYLKEVDKFMHSGIFINSDGAVFPQFVRLNTIDSNLFSATKIARIDDANISVTVENLQKPFITIEAYLKSIETGVVTIALHCIDSGGAIKGKKDFQFSDSAPVIELPTAKLEITKATGNSLTFKVMSAKPNWTCPTM